MPFKRPRQRLAGEFEVHDSTVPRPFALAGGMGEERAHQEHVAGLGDVVTELGGTLKARPCYLEREERQPG